MSSNHYPPRDPWEGQSHDPRVTPRLADQDDSWKQWEGFGQFGVASDELAAVDPQMVAHWRHQQQLWQREQRVRAQASREFIEKRDRYYRAGWISGAVFDLLEVEFEFSGIPAFRENRGSGWYEAWCPSRAEWHSFDWWEERARDWIAGARTHVLKARATPRLPPGMGEPAPATKRVAPERHQRAAVEETAASAPWPPQFNSALAPTPHMRPTPPVWRREPHRKPWEE